MRKKREFPDGAIYHVTSRTNDKIRIFENKLGRKIMLMTLQAAKDKFRFRLANFCVMPTHIHLLIEPREGVLLCQIMQWIKTKSAKWWNKVHGSTDHVWGNRYFAREIKNPEEFDIVMNYIDQNPVKSELVTVPADWKACGAYYKARKLPGLVDFSLTERQNNVKLLSPIPPFVSRLLPPAQLSNVTQFYGVYADVIDRLYSVVKDMPMIGDTDINRQPLVYLHYFSATADYYFCEYDGQDTLWGKVKFKMYHPDDTSYKMFSLKELKSNEFLELDFGWEVTVSGGTTP